MQSRPPIGCVLGALEPAERERQAQLLAAVRARVVETRELAEGLELRLANDADAFREAAEWVALERRCCPFLDFELEWRYESGPSVRLSGGPGTKAFLREQLARLAPPR